MDILQSSHMPAYCVNLGLCALVAMQSEDVGALKWQKAELESRNEMYQAQLMKAQKALERSDQDKAKLEQDLANALAATAASDKSVRDA